MTVCVHTYLRLAKNFLISYADQVYFKFECTPTAEKSEKSINRVYLAILSSVYIYVDEYYINKVKIITTSSNISGSYSI